MENKCESTFFLNDKGVLFVCYCCDLKVFGNFCFCFIKIIILETIAGSACGRRNLRRFWHFQRGAAAKRGQTKSLSERWIKGVSVS